MSPPVSSRVHIAIWYVDEITSSSGGTGYIVGRSRVQKGVAEHLTLTNCSQLTKDRLTALLVMKYPGGFLG